MLFNFTIIFSIIYVLASVIYFFLGFPYRIYVAASAVAPLIFLVMRAIEARSFIDNKLSSLVGFLDDYTVYAKTLPGYRFVDIYQAVVFYTSHAAVCTQIQSQHPEPLTNIINGQFFSETNRKINVAENVSKTTGASEEEFFPTDSFWAVKVSANESAILIRVKINAYTNEVILEIASKDAVTAPEFIKKILQRGSEQSIYKNKMFEVSFAQEVKDAYGDIERHEKLDLIFLEKPPVTDDDIVLDDETRKIIERCIIDFHQRREQLTKAGLPGRRGVLFYGPPGTGKTYTCRYISNRINSATTIITAGTSLLHVKSVFNIARMLQPTIVVLEDVDLVYSSRDRNLYNTALGELMDELDGFGHEDHIIVILTTNAIDRVEEAISERPGRISQCIFFGAPNADLRRRYLNSLLRNYDYSEMDLEKLISNTEGVTQAFLKELVYRTVQIATETQPVQETKVIKLSHGNFQEALQEMKNSAGRFGETIIGFRIDR
jgi:ATP-dependent 26S proteasome regulatory subunit